MNKTEILGKIKSVFFQHFEQVVEDCCMRIDLDFGAQLGKSRGKMSKEHYIKLLEYLHSIRKELKNNYLLKISENFDESYQITGNSPTGKLNFSNLSLSSDDVVQENQLIGLIISQCQSLFYEELASLNKYLSISSVKQTIARSQIPIFPEKLIQALIEVIKPLQLNSEGRIALYNIFEVNVFIQLGFIYRELIKFCDIAENDHIQSDSTDESAVNTIAQRGFVTNYIVGEIKEEIRPILASAEQPSTEFKSLQKKLEQWRLSLSPSAYDLIPATLNVFYEHFEIKNALQILQQFNDDNDQNEEKQPLKWRVLQKLKELSFSDKANNLTQQDEDIMDLVAMIFNEIKREELIEDSVKTTLLQLEIPMVEASLGRFSVFTSQDSPVRQLIDDLFSAGLLLNVEGDDAQSIQARITSSVEKITKENSFDFSGWRAETEAFSNYMYLQKQRSQVMEENLRELMSIRQAQEASRKIAYETIENSIKGHELPTTIVDFLRDVWSEVLLDAYNCKNEQPELWDNSVRVMDDLIISVVPPADDQSRKQLLKMLPGLITELRKSLKLISYAKSAQSRFFKDLAVWHIILMDKKEAKKTVCPINKPKVLTGKINALTIEDESTEQAKNLAEQSWVTFTSAAIRQCSKLIWKDDVMETRVFVGKSGEKMFEIKTVELAEKLRMGQAAIITIDKKTITERALSMLTDL
jgi:predicted transcriptional regulator